MTRKQINDNKQWKIKPLLATLLKICQCCQIILKSRVSVSDGISSRNWVYRYCLKCADRIPRGTSAEILGARSPRRLDFVRRSLLLWVLKETIIQKLLVFERKILRRIFGPTKENRIWRIKTNEELDKLIKHKNIVNYIKTQRLSWFGHVQRMPDTRTVVLKWKSLTKRSQGRPKYRWEDNIKQDICQMKIKNWIACVQNRGE